MHGWEEVRTNRAKMGGCQGGTVVSGRGNDRAAFGRGGSRIPGRGAGARCAVEVGALVVGMKARKRTVVHLIAGRSRARKNLDAVARVGSAHGAHTRVRMGVRGRGVSGAVCV